MYNTCMNNGKLSKKNIENDLIGIFDCFVVMFGEKKTIKLLDEAKKSVRGGNHTQNAVKTRKTTKRSKK